MKLSLKFLFLCCSIHMAFASDYCQMHKETDPVVGDQRLTTFWAQEYVGSDLVRSEMKADKNIAFLSKPNVTIFDLGFEKEFVNLTEEIFVPEQKNGSRKMRARHGTSVANVLNGQYPYGMTDHLNMISLGAILSDYMYKYYFQKFEESNRYPKIISNSVGWSGEVAKSVAEMAYQKNILWFFAAGNKYPREVAKHEISSRAMLVGSMAPSGLQSFNTQVHDDVVILAPANEELATIGAYGKHALFGETSGATPIVAGSMVNVATYIPSITREQTELLLNYSGFSSVENLMGNKKAPGVLNSYRAFKVAKNIYKKCSGDKKCIDSLIKDKKSYMFKSSAAYSCSNFKKLTCVNREKALKELRKEALLSGSSESMSNLSCVYKALGYEKNAEYYKLRARGYDLNHMEKAAKKDLRNGKRISSYYKYFKFYSSDIIRAIKESKISDYYKKEYLKLL